MSSTCADASRASFPRARTISAARALRRVAPRARSRASAPRRSLRVLRVGALTKAQSHLRLDKARIYLARHLPIEHPVPARVHLRGKFCQVRGFMVRVKTKSRDQICRGCCDLISAKNGNRIERPSICRRQNLRRFGRNFEGPGPQSGRKLKTSGTIWPEVCQKHHSGTDFEGARRIIQRGNRRALKGDLRLRNGHMRSLSASASGLRQPALLQASV